jgi:hypothetical protein
MTQEGSIATSFGSDGASFRSSPVAPGVFSYTFVRTTGSLPSANGIRAEGFVHQLYHEVWTTDGSEFLIKFTYWEDPATNRGKSLRESIVNATTFGLKVLPRTAEESSQRPQWEVPAAVLTHWPLNTARLGEVKQVIESTCLAARRQCPSSIALGTIS